MQLRTIQTTSYAHEFQMGPMRVKQPLPSRHLDQVSPFILLHHAGPTQHEAGKQRARLSPHPHRGFEPVTFLFSGKIQHRDSMGNEGFLQGGDVQWMTAGSGVIHSEGPSEEFAREGGALELIQLWVNLPKAQKMTEPRYQDIASATMPLIVSADNKWKIKLVAGSYEDQKGPALTFTPITAMMVDFEADSTRQFVFPASYNVAVYVLNGSVYTGNQSIAHRNLIYYRHDGDGIELTAQTEGRLLLLAGEPINEPVVSHGPFVMNTQEEIMEAMEDFELGKMGTLDY